MNKKQLKIYNWLIDNPGYIKWSKYRIVEAYYNANNGELTVSTEDVEKALKLARIDLKKPITRESLASKVKTYPAYKKPEEFTGKFIRPTLDIRNTLIIGDKHLPFEHEGYLDFCLKVQKEYNCGFVIDIGDHVDNHAVSYHDHDPDGRSPGDEYLLALKKAKDWYNAFPDVKICVGNHDRLPFRKAFTAGLPKNWLKSYQEMFESPKSWHWDFIHKHMGVIYQHGTGLSGEMASINAARENRQSTVIGHLHTVCNTRFLASQKDLIFGMSVGCGIDHEKYAFAYGRENTRKPVLSCGVVINGTMPINIPMNLK
jgi:hypothetical protein